MGSQTFPLPVMWRVSCALSEMVVAPRSQRHGYPSPDATVGVLEVLDIRPFKYNMLRKVTPKICSVIREAVCTSDSL